MTTTSASSTRDPALRSAGKPPSPASTLPFHAVPTHITWTLTRRRCCNRGVTGFANDIPSYRIYNPDDLYCEVADVTTDGIASGGAGRRLQMDEPYLMSEAIDQLVEEFGGEDKILASIPYE